jgi:hypothetical protein
VGLRPGALALCIGRRRLAGGQRRPATFARAGSLVASAASSPSSSIRGSRRSSQAGSHQAGKFADLIAEAAAQDLGDEPGDLRPRLVAAAAAAAIGVIDEDAEHSLETIDSLLVFLRGRLAALQDQKRA